MLVVVTEPTPEGDVVLAALQAELHFLSFGFRLPSTDAAGGAPDKASWVPTCRFDPPPWTLPPHFSWPLFSTHFPLRHVSQVQDVHETLRWIQSQHPQLLVRALIGHGAAADVCTQYACEHGEFAACPTRMLVRLAGGDAAISGWPVGGWKVLTITADKEAPPARARAESYHARHRDKGHTLRVFGGAARSFSGCIDKVGATVNDWIEGARRLNAEDASSWASGVTDAIGAYGARADSGWAVHGAHAGPPSRPPEPVGPPVGSMERVQEIQLECLADDLPVDERMTDWPEERVRTFFENGGGEVV